MSGDKVVRLPIRSGGQPPGGPPDGLGPRVARVETRIDEIARRLDAIDGRLSSLGNDLNRLPSKEFLATTVIAVSGISLAAALAFAALTFNIADYAAKTTQQTEQAKPSTSPGPSSPQPQPIVIVLPNPTGAASGTSAQPAPPPQKLPSQP